MIFTLRTTACLLIALVGLSCQESQSTKERTRQQDIHKIDRNEQKNGKDEQSNKKAFKGKERETLHLDLKVLRAIALSADGSTIAAGGDENVIKVFAADSGKLLKTLVGHENGIRALAIDPNGKTLVSGGGDLKLKLWDLKNEKDWLTFDDYCGSQFGVAFSPDSKKLAYASVYGKVLLVDVDSRKVLVDLAEKEAHANEVFTVAFSWDGKTLASGDRKGRVNLWDLETNTLKSTLQCSDKENVVVCLSFSSDGQALACTTSHSAVSVFDVKTGKERFNLKKFGHQVAFTKDSKSVIVSPREGQLHLSLVDAVTGESQARIEDKRGLQQSFPHGFALSADGKLLVLGHAHSYIRLWDLENKEP
jgi:tricorn protease-like protein